MKNYTRMLQDQFDKAFTIMIGVAAVIAFIAAVFLFVGDITKSYAILNFSVGMVLSVVFVLQKKIKASYKIFVIIIVTMIVAIASFIGGSVYSAYLSVFIISNIIAVLFLRPRYSLAVSIATMCIVVVLAWYSPGIDLVSAVDFFTIWSLQVMGLALLLIVLNISAYYIKKQMIGNIRELEETIEYSNQLAYYDQLTKLPNLNKFLIDVEDIISRYQSDGFVVFFYIENMSLINATLGHKFGDQLLIEVAEILKHVCLEDKCIARTDGNEFAIWFDRMTEEGLIHRLEQIVLNLKQGTQLNEKLRINVAYSSFQYGVDSLNSCYQKAIFALAYVKKNKIQKFTPYNDMIEKELRRNEIIKDTIAEAIRNKDIALYYQPKYDSRNKRIVGVEGLARWETAELGFVSPSEFLPIIESLNLSAAFGNYIIERACGDFAQLQKKYNEGINIAINISPLHIINADIVETMKAAMHQYNIPRNVIYIEITEEIIINQIEIVKPIIRELKAIGIKISLDDFGSGFSSLSYLTQLELDELKVDKSITDQIGMNDKIIPLLENIMHLANQFNLRIIVEGVETKPQNEVLSKLGFHFIQGFYFARPEPLESVPAIRERPSAAEPD